MQGVAPVRSQASGEYLEFVMGDYRVQFEVFEGPLDLLLHLVKKEEVDIYQVNLTKIATEFVAYLEQMRDLDLEVAGEFLVMAATLIYVKSRELLPTDKQVHVADNDADDEDPRFELIRRMVEYKKFKDAAGRLQQRELDQGNTYQRLPALLEFESLQSPKTGDASLFDLISAVSTILKRFSARPDIGEINADPFTVSEKIEEIRQLVLSRSAFRFSELFESARTRTEVVCTFLAMLELIRMKQILCLQHEDFGEIEIRQWTVSNEEVPGKPNPESPTTALSSENAHCSDVPHPV